MANLPRLLPIVFVAVGGVLAMKAITSLDLVPNVFHAAEAFASDKKVEPAAKSEKKAKPSADHASTSAKAASKAGSETQSSADPTQSYAISPTVMAADDAASHGSPAATPAPMTPVCATSIDQLAQQAGMSTNELQILQSLGKRRAQLDDREQQLNTRGQLIDAADSKLDARIKQLGDLKAQIQGLLDQANKVGDDDTARLVSVYSAMKPKDAAAVMSSMDDTVRLPIAAKMKDRALASVLGAMTPDAARQLTEKLAKRMQKADGLQQQLDKATTGSGSGASTAADAGTKPSPGSKAGPAGKSGSAKSGTAKAAGAKA